MIKNIEHRVKEALEDKGFKLDYNPNDSKYRPWYRVPFKINFTNGTGIGSGNMLLQNINIPKNGAYKTIEDIIGGLLHETGHVDIFPVELPLLIYGTNWVADKFDNPIKGVLATVGVMAGYFFIIRELIVEGYNCIKHGAKNYLKLRGGNSFWMI